MSLDRNLLPNPLEYFEGLNLKITGPRDRKWFTTECRLHGGSDSMRVHQLTGGWICMSCGVKGGDLISYEMKLSGDEFIPVVKRLGAWVEDGTTSEYKPPPIPARLALQVLEIEANLICVAATNMGRGVLMAPVDKDRLFEAANRINVIAEVFK